MLIYLFKFFTGHWQKPVCGRISNGWGKRRKWKLKNCFHFPPPPYSSCFPFFDRELVRPRSSISIMLKIILRTTHTIFDELLNRSQNKKLLATTTYNKNWKTKWKTWCLPWRKNKEKNCQGIQKTYLFYLMIFPFL